MKAKRLARLMRDTDAQVWLDLETRGYPNDFNFSQLGTCKKYAIAGGRITPDNKYYLLSLPQFEAKCKADEAMLQAFRSSRTPVTKAKDFLEKRATEELLASQAILQSQQKNTFVQNQGLFSALKSAVHNYVTDVYLAIELGDTAHDLFEEARGEVDAFVRAHCPKAAEQLVAISERLRENHTESWSAALTSCRRLLMTVADSLFPPQSEAWVDSKGKPRKVGADEYKNRLLAFLDNRVGSESSYSIVTSEIEHLAARLDAIYEKSCKGVHTDVSRDEARLAVIQTYLFIAELARFSSPVSINGAG